MPAWTYTDHFFCLLDEALLYRTHKHSNFLCLSTVKQGLQRPDSLCRSLLNWPVTTYHLTVLLSLGTSAFFPLLLVLGLFLSCLAFSQAVLALRTCSADKNYCVCFIHLFFCIPLSKEELQLEASFSSGTTYTYHALQHRSGLQAEPKPAEHKKLTTKLSGQKVILWSGIDSLPHLFFSVPMEGMYLSSFTQKVHFKVYLLTPIFITYPNKWTVS